MVQFPIGFWNYVDIADQGVRDVQDWADAGMTLTMGPYYTSEATEVERMRAILDAAADCGVRVILCHRHAYWPYLQQHGEDAYRREFAQAVADLGDHPAVFGFHVGDEPATADFPFACQSLRIQKELAPQLTPFCNLLPWHQGVETRVGYADWGTYLDAYVAQGQPEVLCYDCYSQMNPGQQGWDMYFTNLREFYAAGARHGIPFWTTLLSVGHFRYRCPREDDIRWQVNTAVAHGAKGLLWFFFYMREPGDNYRVPPIDEHGERTETYSWLSRVNRTFLASQAALFNDLVLRQVRHVGHAWGGYAAFDGVGRVREAHADTDLILSEFTDPQGRPYLAVVNNSQTESTQPQLTIRGVRPQLYRVGWRGVEQLQTNVDGWSFQQGEDFVRVRPWLAPGQLELYRIADEGHGVG